VLTGEHFTATGRTVHVLGLPLVEGNGEHGGFGLDAHIHLAPGHAAVGATEQYPSVALEIRPSGYPDGLRVARHLTDIPAVGLALGIQRLQTGSRPVPPVIGAAEEASAGNGKDRSRTPASHEDAVHVDGIIVHVVPVAHVLPVLAAVEAADDAADFD